MHVRLRRLPFILLSVMCLGVSLPNVAYAQQQVTDADRNAARDLYNEGYTLQQQGRYQEAIDRYGRSLAVFPAPTTAFRMAQCKAAMGQLVEASEELRAITNAALPANPPEAFVKAKQEAAVELQAIEPRIPKIKINVVPSPLAGLSVTVDGTPMSIALVGFARPINPGNHRIQATAPGYSPAQVSVDVREKQQPIPEVTLTLQQAAGGVQYTTTPPQGTTYQTGTQPQTYQPGGTVYAPQGGGVYQNGGYGYSPYGQWVPPRQRPRGPSNALLLGIDAAVSVPFGDCIAALCNSNLSNALGGVGGSVGLDVGLRLARIIYLGAQLQGTFFGGDSNSIGGAQSFLVAALFGLMSNPEGAGVFFEIGGGYRTLSIQQNGITNTGSGGNFILGIGAQVKAGNFRVIPKADLYVGQYSYGFATALDGFFTLGLAFMWELPFDKPVAVSATAQPAY